MKSLGPGSPLNHYLERHYGTDVDLYCSKCMGSRRLLLGKVLLRLHRRGLDPFAFGIRDVAKLVQQPCPCGGGVWVTRPWFPPPNMGMRD